MNHFGLKPNTIDHRDRDLHLSFGTVGKVPTFLSDYSTDIGLGFPNQNAEGQPYGCTNYSSSELTNDLQQKAYAHPSVLERLTHANQLGGLGIRDSLKAAKQLGWISAYYQVRPYAPLDMFDALRLAMSSGIPEKRTVSIGTPWFDAWRGPIPILPMPKLSAYGGWHNWVICGWEDVGGEPMLILKSWQGQPPGFQYISRSVINTVMGISGTVAFTATDDIPDSVATIPVSLFTWLISNLRLLMGLRY